MEHLATIRLRQERPAGAWAWAKHMQHTPTATESVKKRGQEIMQSVEAQSGNKPSLEAMGRTAAFLDERIARQEWRKQRMDKEVDTQSK